MKIITNKCKKQINNTNTSKSINSYDKQSRLKSYTHYIFPLKIENS